MMFCVAVPLPVPLSRPTTSTFVVQGGAPPEARALTQGGPLTIPSAPLPPCLDDRHNQKAGKKTIPLVSSLLTYHVNPVGAPTSVVATFMSSAQAAFGTWNAELNDCGRIDSSNFTFAMVGVPDRRPSLVRFPDRASGTSDGFNDVGWTDLSHYGTTTVGVGEVEYDNDGNPLEWDIALDPARVWSDFAILPPLPPPPLLIPPPDLMGYDVWNVVAHEVGHVIGIAHTASINDTGGFFLTMYHSSWPRDTGKRTLGLGDMLALEERVAERT